MLGYGALINLKDNALLLGSFGDDNLSGPGAQVNANGDVLQQRLYDKSVLVTAMKR